MPLSCVVCCPPAVMCWGIRCWGYRVGIQVLRWSRGKLPLLQSPLAPRRRTIPNDGPWLWLEGIAGVSTCTAERPEDQLRTPPAVGSCGGHFELPHTWFTLLPRIARCIVSWSSNRIVGHVPTTLPDLSLLSPVADTPATHLQPANTPATRLDTCRIVRCQPKTRLSPPMMPNNPAVIYHLKLSLLVGTIGVWRLLLSVTSATVIGWAAEYTNKPTRPQGQTCRCLAGWQGSHSGWTSGGFYSGLDVLIGNYGAHKTHLYFEISRVNAKKISCREYKYNSSKLSSC